MTAPALTGFAPSVVFAENTVNAAPQRLFGDVSLAAGAFDGGALIVSGLRVDDVVSVADGGTGAGMIGLSGADVTWGGAVIGTLGGGAGGALSIAFGAGVDAAAVEALIESLTFANLSNTPTERRTLRLELTDAAGEALSPLAATPLTGAAYPLDGLVSGYVAAPTFADMDGDGDVDALIGDQYGRIRTFRNDGEIGFTELTGADNPHNAAYVGGRSKPVFADVTGDGALNIVVGASDGTLQVLGLVGTDNPLRLIDVGAISAPAFGDVDGDGDIDLLVGNSNGQLRLFVNDGAWAYAEAAGADNPFSSVVQSSGATPAFIDVDGDGDDDLVFGGFFGELRMFENLGAGTFSELVGGANPLDGIIVDYYSTPSAADLDGDGDLELVVGDYYGSLEAFELDGDGIGVNVTVTAENDAPVVTGLPTRAPALEDAWRTIAMDAVQLQDFDDADILSLKIVASQGILFGSTFHGSGVTAAGALSGELTMTGTAQALTTYFDRPDALYYKSAQDDFGYAGAVLSVSVNDGAGSGDVAAGVIHVDIAGVIDPTALTGLRAAATFDENTVNADPQLLFGDATLSDPDDFRYGTLRVSGLLAGDVVSVADGGVGSGVVGLSGADVTYGGIVVGALTGGVGNTLGITFNGYGTSTVVETVIESLTYATASDAPIESRTLKLDLRDGATLIAGIDAGNLSKPAFVDLDGDGDLDAVVGAQDGKIRAYLNKGADGFAEMVGADNPFADVYPSSNYAPTFVDIDGDDDQDLVIGNAYGSLYTYRNEGDGTYVWLRDDDDPFRYHYIEQAGAPSFVDFDNDGDLDLAIGGADGLVAGYASNGDGTYEFLIGGANPFHIFSGAAYAAPTFFDIDGDGDDDAVVGSVDGLLRTFLNDGAGGFTALTGVDNPFDGLDAGAYSAPVFADIDGDGVTELVLGESTGRLRTVSFNLVGHEIDVSVTSQNDAPTLSGTLASLRATEDVDSALDLRALRIVDGDAGDVITLSLVASAGALGLNAAAAAAHGVTYARPQVGVLALTGTVGALNNVLASNGIAVYRGDADAFGDDAATLTLIANDGAGSGDVTLAVIDVDITAVNDLPVLTGLADMAFTEADANAAPQLLFSDVDVADIDGFDGSVLRVSGLLPEDVISVADGGPGAGAIGLSGADVTFGGAVIGAVSGGAGETLRIAFADGVDAAAVEALIESLTYANLSDTPTELRGLNLAIVNANGTPDASYTKASYAPGQLASLDIGAFAAPVFVDYNGDGRLDVVVGEANGKLFTVINDPAAGLRILSGASNPFGGIDVGGSAAPAFADIDGDDDLDLVIGAVGGTLVVYENDGGGGYAPLTGADDPFGGHDFGTAAAPAFLDIDGDGDLDAVIGVSTGVLLTCLNDGAGGFTALNHAASPFSGIDVGSYAKPVAVDLDNDGDLDLAIGARDGTLHALENDGVGGFAALTGAANPLGAVALGDAWYSSPAFADLTGDGDLDILIGDRYGKFHAYLNGSPPSVNLSFAVSVTPGNDAPLAAGDAIATDEDTAITGSVLAANGAGPDVDPDGDALIVSAVNGDAGAVGAQITLASGALLTLSAGGTYDFDPNGAFDAVAVGETMTDSFDYTVADPAGATSTATVTVTIAGVNHAPQPLDDALAAFANAAITGSLLADNGFGADFDIDGDALTVYGTDGQISLASGALLTLSDDGTYRYDPNGAFDALAAGQIATDSFSYSIVDGVLFSDDGATVTVTVTGVNDAPVAHLDLLATDADAVLAGSVLAANGNQVFEDGRLVEGHYAGEADGDVDGDALSVVRVGNSAASVGQPVTLFSGAVLTLMGDGTFNYDPMGAFDWLAAGESAADSFAYTVSDGALRDGAVVALTINGVNEAPEINSPAAFTGAAGDIAVGQVAATDVDGGAPVFSIAGGSDADLFAIDAATGMLSFVDPALTGVYDVIVRASDGLAATDQTVAVTVPSALRAIGEVAELTVGTSWLTLDFANEYIDPVVFALAPSLNEADAAATRFKNISGTGAEIRLQETKKIIDPETGLQINNPGDHADETVTLLVLEKGVHTLEDGTVIQVGELSTSKLYVKGFEDVAFAENFETTPAIFSQVQGVNGTDFIISRQRNPDQSGFQLTMQEEQADNRNHAAEDVGWFAIEHGGGTLSGMAWQAGSSSQNVNGKLTQVMFDAAFDEAPLVVASLASYNGTDTSSPRIGSVTATRFHAAAIEDASYDLETNHGYEIVDWMAFSAAGSIFAAPEAPALALAQAGPETRVAETGFAQAGDVAVTVSFGAAFDNPVVIASLTSMADGAAAIARVFNVTKAGFDLVLQTPDGAAHAPDSVSWMVVEAGSWQLADGTMLQAGLTDPGAGAASVAFDAGFDEGPAVLSQTQTANGAFAKTRMQGADQAGFEVALEGSEAADAAAETVGWIAVDMGAATDADGFVFEAGEVATNQKWAADTFTADFDAPGVVAGMASRNGADAAAARLRAITDQGFQIKAEEDQTHDAETFHAREDFHWIAFDQGQIWGDAIG